MAVATGIPPSIAPSYQQVLQQLQNTASLESTRPTITGTVAGVLNHQNDLADQKGLLEYKAALEDQLNSKSAERSFVNSGGVEVTPQIKSDMEKQAGFPEGTLPDSLIGKRFKSADELQSFAMQPVYRKHMQDSLNSLADEYDSEGTDQSKKYANFLRGTANLPPDKLSSVFDQVQKHIAETTKAQKPVPYADPTSSTGFRWSQPNSDGKYIKAADDLEAPANAGGKVPAPKPIPQTALKSAIDRNNLVDNVQKVIDNYSPDQVGMISSRIKAGEQKVGLGASKKQANFQSAAAGIRNTILNLRNGQRITQQESDRLLQEIPDITSSPKDFSERIQNLSNALNDIQGQYNDSLTQNYSGVPKIKTVNIPDNFGSAKKSTATSEPIIKVMTDPNTKKKYNVQINPDGTRKTLGEVTGG